MKNLTISSAKNYIISNYGELRHDAKKLVNAARTTAKAFKCSPLDVFFLVIENKPIAGMYTHSYGFHTATGRAIIDTFAFNYKKS